MGTITQNTDDSRTTDAFAERLLDATGGTFLVFSVHIGAQLGYYDALADGGPSTAAELASATDAHERYTREWLEQQAVAGVLTVENPDADGEERRYAIPSAYVEVLCDRDSLNYLAPLCQTAVGATHPITRVIEAYRTGAGVPFDAYGRDLHEGQAALNRPAFLAQLGSEWLPTMPGVDARLRETGARVADIGCGHGWSAIGIAETYPTVQVDGYDLDEASVERARENAAARGVSNRVTFHCRDASDPAIDGSYDLVTAFECVHDLSDPVGVLETMYRLAGDDGTVLVMDERVGESFSPDAGDVEAIMYGWSILHCLPVGLAHDPAVGTGTVMREPTLREYATDAGFSSVDVLPIENFFFRFYRLEG